MKHLGLGLLFVLGCATTRPATYASTPSNSPHVGDRRQSFDWEVRNSVNPGHVLLIESPSPAVPPLLRPVEWMCQESPTHEPGSYNMTVRFEAPLPGAYSVVTMGELNSDFRRGRVLSTRSVRIENPGLVTCHFAVAHGNPIEAVHVLRLEVWCPERCGYTGVPVNTVPAVEIDGRHVENGQRRSFFGAYLTTLRR